MLDQPCPHAVLVIGSIEIDVVIQELLQLLTLVIIEPLTAPFPQLLDSLTGLG